MAWGTGAWGTAAWGASASAVAEPLPPVMVGALSITADITTASVLCPTATDDDGIAEYQCSLDGGVTWPYTSATPTVSLTGLAAETDYLVSARAMDVSGLFSVPVLSLAFTTLPAAVVPDPVIPGPSLAFASYAALQSAIARWLHRDDLSLVAPELIALAEARLNRDLRMRQQLTTTTLSAAAGVSTVDLPADWLEFRRLRLVSPDRPLHYVTPDDWMTRRPADQTGCPAEFTIEGDALTLGPLPDAAYTIEASYYARIPALSDDAPMNWLLRDHPSLYLFGALVEAEMYVFDDARSARWEARYAVDLARAMSANSNALRGGAPLRIRSR
jgi:hypothetical protein